MIRTSDGPARLRTLTAMAFVVGLLGACEEGTGGLNTNAAKMESTRTSGPLGERDVEAPEVFQVSEAALWDGRPSLGGVWVAHPDVTEPQRVIIRNTSNGKSVVGALFRRERDIPGPRIQASSDAADALAMLAGAPVQLDVTALVRTPEEEAPAQEPDAEATDSAAVLAEEVDAIVDQASAETAAAVEEPRQTGFRWPWQRKAEAATATTVVASEALDGTAPTSVDVETLEPASSLDKPYIQIGIFSAEENADRAASKVRSAGLTPTVREQAGSGTTLWRVLVGPSQNRSEQSDLLAKVKDSGFSDAYPVTN